MNGELFGAESEALRQLRLVELSIDHETAELVDGDAGLGRQQAFEPPFMVRLASLAILIKTLRFRQLPHYPATAPLVPFACFTIQNVSDELLGVHWRRSVRKHALFLERACSDKRIPTLLLLVRGPPGAPALEARDCPRRGLVTRMGRSPMESLPGRRLEMRVL